jgi:hypothetical protein
LRMRRPPKITSAEDNHVRKQGRNSGSARFLLTLCVGITLASGMQSVVRAEETSLALAYKIISSKRFVDLTHTFSPSTPV